MRPIQQPGEVWPAYTLERRVRAGFVGCGDHAFRNIYPALRYCTVDLIVVCDLDRERADNCRRIFGAERSTVDHRELLDAELDAVFIVTGYEDENGTIRTTHGRLACEFLDAGVSTWVEKPPANNLAEIRSIRNAKGTKAVAYAVGYKKAFTPATQHVLRLMQRPEFGTLSTLTARYPQPMPAPDDMPDGIDARWFLDHLSHPLSLIRALGGPTRALSYARSKDGTGFIMLQLAEGASAVLHLGPYSYRAGLAERTEVNGEMASIVVENNVRVTWYPAGQVEPYGRAPDFTAWDGVTQWEPEFSLGQLYNKGEFLLGYQPELAHFCDAVRNGRDVDVGGIDAAEEHLRVFSALQEPPHRMINLDQFEV